MTAATEWGVRVNEVGIFANRHGVDWWLVQIARWGDRALSLGQCLAGGIWFLPGGERDDAEFMRDHMISHGIHRNCLKVTTRAKAEAELESRLEKSREYREFLEARQ